MHWLAFVGLVLNSLLPFAWASPIADAPVSCSSEKLVSEDALRLALTHRSLEIVKLATQGNTERLRASVRASAKFNMGEHDVLWEIGNGPEGAIALVKRLRPSNFQFTTMDSGPPPPVTACSEQKVSLLLIQSSGGQAYEATFQFKDGQLVQAWAHDINLYSGKIEANQKRR